MTRLQYDWTPLEQLYWRVSREYLRAYRSTRDVVLAQYSPEEQQLIKRFEVARGDERSQIQSVITANGNKLISDFTSNLNEFRKRYRKVDPELDAWCYFFGQTSTLYSDEAKSIYYQLVKDNLGNNNPALPKVSLSTSTGGENNKTSK
jgi:hypothetical protein